MSAESGAHPLERVAQGLAALRRRLRGDRPRRPRLARVTLREEPVAASAPGGGVSTRQAADVALPVAMLERIWTPEYLERLAATYWRFLERVSLGLLRVIYTPHSREVVLVRRPFVLLRFRAPEYDTEADRGSVTWPIDRGLLVIPRGRGKGFLRISVERPDHEPQAPDGQATLTVRSEVVNFYPLIAGAGWFARIGRIVYRVTQLQIHIVVTNAFLRSLARLDLAPSRVGTLRDDGEA